jgi:hypothetical protein
MDCLLPSYPLGCWHSAASLIDHTAAPVSLLLLLPRRLLTCGSERAEKVSLHGLVRRYAAGPVTGGGGWLRWVNGSRRTTHVLVVASLPTRPDALNNRHRRQHHRPLGTTMFGSWVLQSCRSTLRGARIGYSKTPLKPPPRRLLVSFL